MKMRLLATLAVAAIPISGVIAAPASQSLSATTATDAQIHAFLDKLVAGKSADAVDSLMGSSPLWSQRTGARDQMLGQIDTAIKVYGPITGYERVSHQMLGTMAARDYYLVQHRDFVTRWEFDSVKAGSGWNLGYFGFADQPMNWF